MKKLLLIDGNNLLFRSYFATAAMGNLMKNSQGVYTNAVFGFASTMQQLLKTDFTHILVAWDPKGPTHRHLEFSEYKGTRPDVPEELISQMPLVREYLDAVGVPRYEQDLYEADDIIGYCATHYRGEFDAIEIYSNDHDLMQLLSDNVSQIVSKKGLTEVEVFTPSSMKEKLGIGPSQIPDYKGMVGDASDNIPGIPGVGDKTAVKLLNEYGTLENVLDKVDGISGKLKEKIAANVEVARFSKRLATIVTEFSNSLSSSKLEYRGGDPERIRDFMRRMEFHSLLKKIEIERPKSAAAAAPYRLLSADELEPVLSGGAAVCIELFGANYHAARILGFGIANESGAYFVDFETFRNAPALIRWMGDPAVSKDTYDLKQMKVALKWAGYETAGFRFDLMLASYLTNPNLTRDDFRSVVAHFGCDAVAYDEEVFGRGAKYALPDDPGLYRRHAADKAVAVRSLKAKILAVNAEYGQTDLLEKIEIPLAETLAEMEYAGIRIDERALEAFGADLSARASTLEKEIYALAGEEFNIQSPKQLGTILFEKLQLPYYKKTKSGYSTDSSVLDQLAGFHPIVDKITEFRSATKLHSTYYEGLKAAIAVKNDGRVHTIYKQTLTQTGRLSSIEPNLQNIPVRTEEGKELRRVFIPSDSEHLLFSCDYSQIELRILAEMAGVKSLIEAFCRGEDIHAHTARLVFSKAEVTADERRQAKAVNFGLIYGKTAWGLAEDLKISPKQAETFIADYFAKLSEIRTFMDASIADAKTKGYVTTLFHRRRYIPEATADNYMVREVGKRMAMNAPIQGTAADILKIAMVRIRDEFASRGLKARIILQIHDELVFDVPVSERATVAEVVVAAMEHAVPFAVPLKVEGDFGTNLYEVK
ncbi:MAG: DNA polymerase I [Candidatus Izemoplasmatales bacterium]